MKFLNRLFKKSQKKPNTHEYTISADEAVAYFETWETEERRRREAMVKAGVKALREGRPVAVSNQMGDGMELALAVKKQFIFEETQKLNKWIKIDGLTNIVVTFKPE